MEDALTSAFAYFSVWSETYFAERAIIGMRAAEILRTRTDEFAQLATLEMGKLYAQARAEVHYRLRSGIVFVNHPTWTAPELPFGGINNSGCGRELSRSGSLRLTNRYDCRILYEGSHFLPKSASGEFVDPWEGRGRKMSDPFYL